MRRGSIPRPGLSFYPFSPKRAHLTMQSAKKYDDYSEGGGDGGQFDDVTLKVSPYSMIQGTLTRVFGASPPWGEQSLGTAFEDVSLEDGVLYADPETGKLKTFGWSEVLGVDIAEAVDDGVPFGPHAAHDRLTRTYGDSTKTYRIVGARSEIQVDEDGTVTEEPASIVREYEIEGDGDDATFSAGDWTDLGGDLVPIGESIIMWHGGSTDYGPSTVSKRLATILTTYGTDAIVDEGDINGWLVDTSGDNIVRPELADREVRFFITQRESEESDRSYNFPIVEDLKTEEQITISNDENGGDSGN